MYFFRSSLCIYDIDIVVTFSDYDAGAAVLALFFESLLKMCGNVAIHIAYGEISRGKSNAVRIALAAACNLRKGFQTYLSESIARHHLGGALPFAFDDPSDTRVLKQLLINAFGGAEMATQRHHFSARCNPIITANTFAIDELVASDSRYIIYVLSAKLHSL